MDKFSDSSKMLILLSWKGEPTDKKTTDQLVLYHYQRIISRGSFIISKVIHALVFNKLYIDFVIYGTSYICPVKLLQQWQNKLDNSGFIGTILMDRSMDAYPWALSLQNFKFMALSKESYRYY